MYHNQIDYIMVRGRFVTNVFLTPIRQEASQELTWEVHDHDLVMMSFWLRLKKIKMQGPTRVKDPQISDAFRVMIGGKFAPFTLLGADDTEGDTLLNTLNEAMTETASEILGKRRAVKIP